MKHYPLLVFFILTYALASAKSTTEQLQDSIKIDITIDNKDSGNIKLLTPAGIKILDLKGGRASISLKLDRVCEIALFTDPDVRDLDDSSIVRFLVQSSDVAVSLSIIDGVAENVRITGSKAQMDKENWEKGNYDLLKTIVDLRKALWIKRNSGNNYSDKKLDSLNSRLDWSYTKISDRVFRLVETNPDSYAGGYLLCLYRTKIPQDSLEKYYLKLSPSVQQAQFSVAVFDQLYTLSSSFRKMHDNTHAELKNAQTVFDLTIQDMNEQPVKLSKFKGKPILLFFWATWCGGCHTAAKDVDELINEFKNGPITFLSVSLDKNPEEFKKSNKKIDLPCVTLIDHNNILRYYYQFLYLPTFILLDHNGKVICKDPSNDTLEYEISSAIKQYHKDIQLKSN